MSKLKPIYFVVRNPRQGSNRLRGVLIAEGLRRIGLEAQCLADPKEISDSIVVFIKDADLSHLQRAAERGNQVVYDYIDPHVPSITSGRKKYYLENVLSAAPLSGVIFPNRRIMARYANLPMLGSAILHPWDTRCAPVPREDKFSLVWFGYSGPDLGIPELVHHSVEKGTWSVQDEVFKEVGKFTCHLIVRDEAGASDQEINVGREDLRYISKSNIKLSTAAAFNANAIITMDGGSEGLLPSDYPYITAANREAVMQTIETARNDYGSARWSYGLEQMQEIKERTRLSRIVLDYVHFFRQLD